LSDLNRRSQPKVGYREESVDEDDDEPADAHQEKNEAVGLVNESFSLSEFCIVKPTNETHTESTGTVEALSVPKKKI
jgi:hypothetical protein